MTVGGVCKPAEKKPPGVTPSAFSCDCRLDLRCRRGFKKPATAWLTKG
jgi:hypothetical protein